MYKFTLIMSGQYYVSNISFQTKEAAEVKLEEVCTFLVSLCGISTTGFVHMA